MPDPVDSFSKGNRDRSFSGEIGAFYQSQQLFRDRYRVLRSLGQGGFGVTYLAQDMRLPGQPSCVIKQLAPKSQSSQSLERAKVRFRREAKVLANLGSHSQIPCLLDYFTIRGEFYLVQEYIQGQTLAQEVRQQGRQTEAQVKYFLQEMVPVLQFIHRNRIIHRDIKPPNIIRSEFDRRLVLIDFGAVREFLADLEESHIYQSPVSQFVGTPGFAPPEQLALRPCYGSDIYALGMTCLFLLTTCTPAAFDSDPKTGQVRWRSIVTVSDHFGHILDKMLRPDPTHRYESIDHLVRDLALEPHLDSLTQCLSTTRSAPLPTSTEELSTPEYLTAVQRQAQAIRAWRTRRFNRATTS
ncbi:MAG: serine/threonine-protein kinase [Leptolyngbya sp.]|nr:serine/threonine-protein kinase [Leptolyngbya sp.]